MNTAAGRSNGPTGIRTAAALPGLVSLLLFGNICMTGPPVPPAETAGRVGIAGGHGPARDRCHAGGKVPIRLGAWANAYQPESIRRIPVTGVEAAHRWL